MAQKEWKTGSLSEYDKDRDNERIESHEPTFLGKTNFSWLARVLSFLLI